MSEGTSLPAVYRRFLDGELTLQEAAAILSAQTESGVAASETLAPGGDALLGSA
jgi:hypothetical protein